MLPQRFTPQRSLLILPITMALLATGCDNTKPTTSADKPTTMLSDSQKQALNSEANAIIKPFGTELMGTVKTSIQTSGAPKTVEVCKTLAPQITAKYADKTHAQGHTWSLRRTSEKIRNPNNAPDEWETKVLQQFAEQAKQGADLSKLSYGEQVGNQYRYMKAIAIAEPCLACHGTDVKQPVHDMLKQHYPNDKAIGFNAGDLRGAFSLSTPIS